MGLKKIFSVLSTAKNASEDVPTTIRMRNIAPLNYKEDRVARSMSPLTPRFF